MSKHLGDRWGEGAPTTRVLVAGIGNLFNGDDGFGPEVVRRLAASAALPEQVRVVDYGIRGMHLAYDLLDDWDALVLVDAVPGEWTQARSESSRSAPTTSPAATSTPTAWPQSRCWAASLGQLGGTLPPTYVVGCRPETTRGRHRAQRRRRGRGPRAAVRHGCEQVARRAARGRGEGLLRCAWASRDGSSRSREGYAGQVAVVDVGGGPAEGQRRDAGGAGGRAGEWVLIHMGFAVELIDEATARDGTVRPATDGERARGPSAGCAVASTCPASCKAWASARSSTSPRCELGLAGSGRQHAGRGGGRGRGRRRRGRRVRPSGARGRPAAGAGRGGHATERPRAAAPASPSSLGGPAPAGRWRRRTSRSATTAARARRPGRPPLPAPVHHLHQLRPAVHDHHRAALRPGEHHDGRVRDVPRLSP